MLSQLLSCLHCFVYVNILMLFFFLQSNRLEDQRCEGPSPLVNIFDGPQFTKVKELGRFVDCTISLKGYRLKHVL